MPVSVAHVGHNRHVLTRYNIAPALQQQLFHGSALPQYVKLFEVGPRDGLQNEKKIVPTDKKIEFINKLADTGLQYIEATSFVSAKWVPQMGDASEVMTGVARRPGVTYSALTPNIKGFESALEAGCKEVAIFAAATDAFSMRNINCNVLDSFERFKPLIDAAKANNVRVRGYVSCVVGCPYSGVVAPEAVAFVAQTLLEMGCYEISLGDTIGVGTPLSVKAMLSAVKKHVPTHALAIHVHNTWGQGLANILASLEEGVAVVDASVAGLGGCPYARGASGNIATEDVIFMLHGMGIKTNVDFDALVDVGSWICAEIGRESQSKAGAARAGAKAAAQESAGKLEAARAAVARLTAEAAEAEKEALATGAAAADGGGSSSSSSSAPLAGSCGVAAPPAAAAAAPAAAGAASGAASKALEAAIAAVASAQKDVAAKQVSMMWPATPEHLFDVAAEQQQAAATVATVTPAPAAANATTAAASA